MEDNTELIELKGALVFLPYAAGSKSESVRPYLYVSKDQIIKVMKTGDNPFENNALIPFDGHLVRIVGRYGMGKTFLIEEIADFREEASAVDSIEVIEESVDTGDSPVVEDTNEEEK